MQAWKMHPVWNPTLPSVNWAWIRWWEWRWKRWSREIMTWSWQCERSASWAYPSCGRLGAATQLPQRPTWTNIRQSNLLEWYPTTEHHSSTTKCNKKDWQALLKGLKDTKSLSLRVLFIAKTHKPEPPFRVIISEQGNWKGRLEKFLQRGLKKLKSMTSYSEILKR